MSNKDVIALLDSIDLSAYPYDAVRSLVNQFQPKVLRLKIAKGCRVERIRPDLNVFERKGVSYRPEKDNNRPQRATLPGKTAFYGTLCHENESPFRNRYIALLEASKLIKEGTSASGTEGYTLSQWVTTDEIKLAVFAHDSVFQGVYNNPLLEMAKQEWVRNKSFLDDVFQYEEYAEYVTKQFAKHVIEDYEYLITATVAEKLMYDSKLDGVIYPSVQAEGQYGMNVALRPDIADTMLSLQDVREMKYEQSMGKGCFSFTKVAFPVEIDSHGMKRWIYTDYNNPK